MFSWKKNSPRSFVLSCDVGALAGVAEVHQGLDNDNRWRASVLGVMLVGYWEDPRVAKIRAETWLYQRFEAMITELKALQAKKEAELEEERRANDAEANAESA